MHWLAAGFAPANTCGGNAKFLQCRGERSGIVTESSSHEIDTYQGAFDDSGRTENLLGLLFWRRNWQGAVARMGALRRAVP